MATTIPPHIKRDDRGVAWIDETNVKVIEVVLDRLAYGWSPEEIHFQHPGLSLAQIYGPARLPRADVAAAGHVASAKDHRTRVATATREETR